MGGSWGLSLRLGDLDDAQRQTVRGLIAEYRQLRELQPGAEVYHLAPALTIAPTAVHGPEVTDWFALQYVQPESRRGAILVVRNGAGAERQTLKLRGLLPERSCQLIWSDGRLVADESGAALMASGIAVSLPPYSGRLIWIAPAS